MAFSPTLTRSYSVTKMSEIERRPAPSVF